MSGTHPGIFRRPHHQAILKALHWLDEDLLLTADCFFAGGTAIVLELDEYRESVDIDFLCASQDGYRILREAVWGRGISGLMKPNAPLKPIRDMKADQYGIRCFIEIEGTRIKFEIVREGRIALLGAMSDRYMVPLLCRQDMYAEKLLANADRFADRAVFNRDMIDLSMMIAGWGNIPEDSWTKAFNAYGETVYSAYDKALAMIRDESWLRQCMQALQMTPGLTDTILNAHSTSEP